MLAVEEAIEAIALVGREIVSAVAIMNPFYPEKVEYSQPKKSVPCRHLPRRGDFRGQVHIAARG